MTQKSPVTLETLQALPEMSVYITKADDSLKSIGYTEHSFPHITTVLERAAAILNMLDRSEREVELARVAGYMHDIGNIVNRHDHAQTSAVMAYHILDRLGMPPAEIADVICAIGNHDEGTGLPINALAAALIIADKSDVRRNRVRSPLLRENDIHDRVNGAVDRAEFELDKAQKTITLSLTIDTEQCSVMEYFKIFLNRMQLCQNAAGFLKCQFRLVINGAVMLG